MTPKEDSDKEIAELLAEVKRISNLLKGINWQLKEQTEVLKDIRKCEAANVKSRNLLSKEYHGGILNG